MSERNHLGRGTARRSFLSSITGITGNTGITMMAMIAMTATLGCSSSNAATHSDAARVGDDPGCPQYMPEKGSACTGSSSCTWRGPCGAGTTDYLGGCAGGTWVVEGMCAPPLSDCPSTKPAYGAPCSEIGSCSWSGKCGDTREDFTFNGVCDGTRWNMYECLVGTWTCPDATPKAGSSCVGVAVPEGAASCRYKGGVPGPVAGDCPLFCGCNAGVWSCALRADCAPKSP
jgi:hypothetical protein